MDDQNDSLYSRTPTLPDLIRICKSLNQEGAKYVLIGGFAVILHGYVRGTKDIDFLVDTTKENIRKIKKAMAFLPDNAAALIEDNAIKKYQVVRVADEFVVDLMAQACGVNYKKARQGIQFYEIEGVVIPVAGKELLIQTKQTIRSSDKTDVGFLRHLLEEEKKNRQSP